MLIVEVMGGLGNQLQQYALYRKMKSMGKEVKLDVSWYTQKERQEGVLAPRHLELSWFENLPMELCTQEEKARLAGGEGLGGKLRRKLAPGTVRHFWETDLYHPEIFSFTEMYLTGFWACEKYYADILPQLRREIVFPSPKKLQNYLNNPDNNLNCGSCPNLQKSQNWQNCENYTTDRENLENIPGKELYEKNCRTIMEMKRNLSVSIHVRRGDYLDPENAALFGGICTEAYYEGAIRYVLDRWPEAHFYLFSDDPAYVRERYRGERYTVVDWNTGANSLYDIQLMSSCRHNICANSTFSFWGARLNPNPDKIMIRPAKHKNSQGVDPEKLHELWEGWVILDGEGRVV